MDTNPTPQQPNNPALANAHTIKTQVCARCWGALVEKFIDGQYRVVCAAGCDPIAFVSRDRVEQMKRQAHHDYQDVIKRYPQLAPKPKPINRAESKRLLYGDN